MLGSKPKHNVAPWLHRIKAMSLRKTVTHMHACGRMHARTNSAALFVMHVGRVPLLRSRTAFVIKPLFMAYDSKAFVAAKPRIETNTCLCCAVNSRAPQVVRVVAVRVRRGGKCTLCVRGQATYCWLDDEGWK